MSTEELFTVFRNWMKKVSTAVAIIGVCVILAGGAAYLAGARVNTTKSIPLGLYWTSSAPVEKGAYVLFCPPKISVFDEAKKRGYIGAGFCPSGHGYMMKRVLAVKDDRVTVRDDGVRVNGKLLPYSAPFKADKAGREMPRYQADDYTLANVEVLLMSDVSGTSFDGRYFGPINRSQIKTVIRPAILW